MVELPDCDNFVVGNKFLDKDKPFEYNLKKVSEYLKSSGKSFLELSKDEIRKLK